MVPAPFSVTKDTLKIPANIRVGVSGRRCLMEMEGLIRDKVREGLDQFDRLITGLLPDTPRSYICVTPLAEGADQLVADEVLKFRPHTDAPALHSVSTLEIKLPYAESKYYGSLGLAAQVEYKRLRCFGGIPEVLPLSNPKYTMVGHYVVRRSDVIVFILDKRDDAGKGGSREIFSYAKDHGKPIILVVFEKTEAGDNKVELVTKFGKGAGVGICGEFSVDPVKPADFPHLKQLNEYNKRNVNLGEIQISVDKRYDNLVAGAAPHVKTEIDRYAPFILPHHAKSSELSWLNQTAHFHTGLAIYILSAFAVTIVALQKLLGWPNYWVFLEVMSILLIGISIWISASYKYHAKWTDYRFLSERLRTLLFTCASGTACYPPKTSSLQADWVADAYVDIWKKSISGTRCAISPISPKRPWPIFYLPPADQEVKKFLLDRWIRNQKDKFFGPKSKKLALLHTRYEVCGYILFGLTLIAAFLHSFSIFENVETLLVLIALVFPAIGATLHGIRGLYEFQRNSKRYKYMEDYLADMVEDLGLAGNIEVFNSFIEDAEQAMYNENLDWRLTFFARRHEVP